MAYDASPENRLAAVRAAIGACLTAQQYSIAGRSAQRAELRQLRQLERELIEEVQAAADGGSMCSLGIQTPPSP